MRTIRDAAYRASVEAHAQRGRIVHRAFHAFQNTRPLTISKTGELVSAARSFDPQDVDETIPPLVAFLSHAALEAGYISVTPLSYDLTHYPSLDGLEDLLGDGLRLHAGAEAGGVRAMVFDGRSGGPTGVSTATEGRSRPAPMPVPRPDAAHDAPRSARTCC